MSSTCLHCGKTCSSRRVRRGLCRRCYGSPADGNAFPGVRHLYPHTGSLARLGHQSTHSRDFTGAAPLPLPEPIEPGPARVALLGRRARRRQALFHPREPAYPVAIPRPGRDYNGMWLWRLLLALDPSILECLRDASVA